MMSSSSPNLLAAVRNILRYYWIVLLLTGAMMDLFISSCSASPVALKQESPWPGSLVRDSKLYAPLEASPVRSKRAISDFFRDLIAETFGEETTPQPKRNPSRPVDQGSHVNPEPVSSVNSNAGDTTGLQSGSSGGSSNGGTEGVSNGVSSGSSNSKTSQPAVRDATPTPAATGDSGATGNKWLDLILGAILGGGAANADTGTGSSTDSTGNTIVNMIASAAVQHILSGVLAG
ncbi:hypothetical protein RvY_05086-1 [Ramazzottius varieornatus]|uniref:Uncharacterized protein n=1 Tax=Ramazzottius varieornatus TaxID=947166 RepID=A0A1D1V3R7_RAMVA|nr:hypothetical protein RvY_05086-1 [Ramazzottius varieornatus]